MKQIFSTIFALVLLSVVGCAKGGESTSANPAIAQNELAGQYDPSIVEAVVKGGQIKTGTARAWFYEKPGGMPLVGVNKYRQGSKKYMNLILGLRMTSQKYGDEVFKLAKAFPKVKVVDALEATVSFGGRDQNITDIDRTQSDALMTISAYIFNMTFNAAGAEMVENIIRGKRTYSPEEFPYVISWTFPKDPELRGGSMRLQDVLLELKPFADQIIFDAN